MNPNPVVAQGPCRRCGQPVLLFEADAADYLANPIRGLEHLTCPMWSVSDTNTPPEGPSSR